MRTENIVALLVLVVIAVLVAACMVETYWDCRLVQHKSERECMPPTGGGGIVGI
jgi:hypothetical protein